MAYVPLSAKPPHLAPVAGDTLLGTKLADGSTVNIPIEHLGHPAQLLAQRGERSLLANAALGARNDGGGDNTAAFAALHDALPISGAPLGGVLQLPPGTFRFLGSASITKSNVTIRGAGPGLTQVYFDTATGIGLDCNGGSGQSNLTIADMTINCFSSAGNTRTGGRAIPITKYGDYRLENLRIRNGWDAIYLSGCSSGVIRNVDIDTTLGAQALNNGITVTGGCIALHLDRVTIASARPFNYGLLLDSGMDTFTAHALGVDGNNAARGIMVTNTGSLHDPRWLRFHNCFVEAAGEGVYLHRCYDATWEEGYIVNGTLGLVIGSNLARAIRVRGGVISLCAQSGVRIDGGAQLDLDGLAISDVSQAIHNTYHGIQVGANVGNWQVRNCQIGDFLWRNTNKMRYGVRVEAGTSDRYRIERNNITNPGTAAVSDLGTGTTKVVQATDFT